MVENELNSGLTPADKAASSSRIRAVLGERLRDYYDRLQHIPPSDRIQTLVAQLEQRMQEETVAGEGAQRASG